MDNFKTFYKLKDDSKEVADSITNKYLNSLFENRQSEKVAQEYSGLDLNDINENITTLKNQFELLERFGRQNKIPCITIGETKIPIDIFQYLQDGEKISLALPDLYDRYYYGPFFMEKGIDRLIDRIDKMSSNIFSIQSLDFVRSNIQQALSSFIEIRHASFLNSSIRNKISKFFGRGAPPTSSIGAATKYLTVTVNTSNYGLDLSASPAYFGTWKKFGSPTSPVVGYLKPGTYIFGGSGVGAPTFIQDPTPADIPPNFSVTLTKI